MVTHTFVVNSISKSKFEMHINTIILFLLTPKLFHLLHILYELNHRVVMEQGVVLRNLYCNTKLCNVSLLYEL